MKTILRGPYHLILMLAVFAVLQSCGTAGQKPDGVADPFTEAKRWEELARTATGEQRAVYQLSAAEAWYLSAEVERAMFSLLTIDSLYLPANQLVDFSLLLAEIFQLQGRHQEALEALEQPVIQNRLFDADPEKQAFWAERTGNIHLVLGENEQAALYFDHALSLGKEDLFFERLRTSLWRSLTLSEDLPEPPFSSAEMPGWIALAEISNINAGTLSEQLQQFQNWRTTHFGHPADLLPPDSIQILADLANEPAPRVALLLPLSGDLSAAGNAVLDGYLATAVENRERDPLNPTEVLVFDTNSQSISAILRELRELQVKIVIGPLQKDMVAALTLLADADMRILTLNSIENAELIYEKSILGLALDIEDEARQAATAAMRDGYQTALALVPNSSSGDRAGQAFSSVWEEQNGVLVGVDRFGSSETHADLLESRLHIDQSYSRMRELRTLLAQNLEFTPRRRNDIDALFLSASGEQARQIKPMLAFFYAEDIPVYSTSNIYDGTDDTKVNQDLNGIKFSTLPWLVSDSNVHEALKIASPKSGSLLKLQAMGVDAYYLSQRIPQFINAESTVYHGVLGTLSLPPGERSLDRQQVWAEFSGGLVAPLP